MELSTGSKQVLENLRFHVESTHGEFGSVYLDNARPSGMSPHAFAGHLSALAAAGLYRAYDDEGYFGEVKLADEPEVIGSYTNGKGQKVEIIRTKDGAESSRTVK